MEFVRASFLLEQKHTKKATTAGGDSYVLNFVRGGRAKRQNITETQTKKELEEGPTHMMAVIDILFRLVEGPRMYRLSTEVCANDL